MSNNENEKTKYIIEKILKKLELVNIDNENVVTENIINFNFDRDKELTS